MSRIFLVRHGQASWGAADYDALSDLGRRQGPATGSWLAGQGIIPARVVSGSLVRQRDTAHSLVVAAGWSVETGEDQAWNEYDHLPVLAAVPADDPARAMLASDDRRTAAAGYFLALDRWISGAGGYPEAFAAFTTRAADALTSLAASLAPKEDAVVVSSGGVISAIGAHLLDGGPGVWKRLAMTVANASVSQVRVGAHGIHLMSFNEASHLGELWSSR